MSEQVRHLIGLENLLSRARRRQRECERDEGVDGARTRRFAEVVRRLGEEIHATDRAQLEGYLRYVEGDLVPRILHRVEGAKEGMVDAAKRVVAGKAHLLELRTEYSDALERSRSVRERLGLDPIVPAEARFGLGSPPPHSERATREAYDLVKEFLKG